MTQTIRAALRAIRADLAGVDYLPGGGPVEYECDQGLLWVCNAAASDGGGLLGVFSARLIGRDGQTIRVYRV